MKIGIVGDLHIAPVPQNRIDDYFHTALDKIIQIARVCDEVIFLGDVFSTPKVDEQYTNRLIRFLLSTSALEKCNFHTIIGNHDVGNELESNLIDNSSLGTLYACGAINVIFPNKPLILKDKNVTYRFNTIPVNFKRAREYDLNGRYGNDGYEDILLIHHEYETGTNCFIYEDLKNCRCNKIFFGHDHKPLDGGRIQYTNGQTVYRCGSLMRNIAQDYNFTRTIYYYILENNNVSCQQILAEPAQNVFKIQAITRENYQKQKFIESIDKVIEKYKKNISKQTRFYIKNVLEELNAPPEVIYGIQKKYEKLGEKFE